jgi:signal transduction histidine kinase
MVRKSRNDSPASADALTRRPGRWVRLAWIPIPLLLAAIIVARSAGLSGIYESTTLLLVLSFTFYTLVSLGTLYLIGRSFLGSGSPGMLLLECGVLLWSMAGTIGDLVSHGDANINVTIFNTSILLAGLCLLAGTILALSTKRVLRLKFLWLGVCCAFTLGALWLVSHAALSGWLPVFFIPGQGGTQVRYLVLISAIAMFVLSAGLLKVNQRSAHLPFTSWYALALLLLAVGLFGVMIQLSLGCVVNWLSRTAQWLGGIYLLFAAFASLRESQLPILPLPKQSSPAYYRDAIAVSMVLVTVAIRLTFLSALEMQAPFVTFFPAVTVAAIYGRLRAGLLATVLSAIFVDYFWIGGAGFGIKQASDWLALMIFLISGVMISGVSEAMHRARDNANAAEKQALLATERAAAAEALRESEEKYRSLFENMTEEVHFWKLVRDENGQIKTWRLVDINPPALKAWGRKSREETIGRIADEIYPGATAHFMPIVQKIMTEGVPYSLDDYFPPPVDKYFRFTSVPLGEYYITTGADITDIKKIQIIEEQQNIQLEAANTRLHEEIAERKRAETALAEQAAKLQEHTAQLEALNKELESFTYSVSHDLRAPLRAIDGFSRMILKQHGGQFDENTKRQFDVIRNNTKMMEQLIDDLLALSRLDRSALSISRLNIDDLIKDVWEDLKTSNPERPVDFKIGPVPPCQGDRSLIKQVLINLLSNAVKFSKVRDVPFIEVGGHSAEDESIFYIRDNGVGFDMQYHDKLFGVFQRLHTAGDFEGTGVGLAIVQRVILRHGGRIWAESEPDKGATFYFTLPSGHE